MELYRVTAYNMYFETTTVGTTGIAQDKRENMNMCEKCLKKMLNQSNEDNELTFGVEELTLPDVLQELSSSIAPLLVGSILKDALTGKKDKEVSEAKNDDRKNSEFIKNLISKKGIRSYDFSQIITVFEENPDVTLICVDYPAIKVHFDKEVGLMDSNSGVLMLFKEVLQSLYVIESDLELVYQAEEASKQQNTQDKQQIMVSFDVAMQSAQQGHEVKVDFTAADGEVATMTLKPGANIPYEALSGVFYVQNAHKAEKTR